MKECGDEFKGWLKQYHLGIFLTLVTCALGSRQNLTIQGSISLYRDQKYYLGFLAETIEVKPDNVLISIVFMLWFFQSLLLLYFLTQLFMYPYVPMRFLAGKSHEFEKWSCRKMGKVIDFFDQKAIILRQITNKFFDYNPIIVKFSIVF